MKKIMNRYKYFLILAALNLGLLAINPIIGQKSLSITWSNTYIGDAFGYTSHICTSWAIRRLGAA
jgi:hypothetical protein